MKIKIDGLDGELSIKDNSFGFILCNPHPLFGGRMDNPLILEISRCIPYTNLRFNYRSRWGGGKGEREDLISVMDFFRKNFETRNIGVIGYSFGSWIALTLQPDLLILISPPLLLFDFSEVLGMKCRKFFIVGGKDNFCPRDEFLKFYGGVKEPKEMRFVEGANHFWNGYEKTVAEIINEWLRENS